MTFDNTVTLRVGGNDYAGWLSVGIEAGIERLARSFDIGVTSSWPGASAADIARRVKPGDACEVRIGADRVITGWIDATPISYDKSSISVSIRGRSKTADLVDCSATNSPGQWSRLSVERIADALASTYGVSVLAEIETQVPVAVHTIEQGETVSESLDRLLSPLGLLATDDGDGNLVLISIGMHRADDALELGKNILSGDAALDDKDRFRTYIVKGQAKAADDLDGTGGKYHSSGTAVDDKVLRPRVLIIKQSGQGDGGKVADRATYERDHRKARAAASTYEVQGWRQSSGALWTPNMLVQVRDSVLGWDTEMLITEVAYSLGDGKELCRLSVGPKAGYIAPVVVHALKKAKKVTYVE